jgi:hypothetical protein
MGFETTPEDETRAALVKILTELLAPIPVQHDPTQHDSAQHDSAQHDQE